MQEAVVKLVELGPMPQTAGVDINRVDPFKIKLYEQLLTEIHTPVTDEEAVALLSMFGPDDCFGMSWSLVHIIETAPGWLTIGSTLPADDERDGIQCLRIGISNHFALHPNQRHT